MLYEVITNRLWIFGTRRGTGESIWELKKRMGIVSTDLHRNYRVAGSVLDCVLSGLYDTIGLYQRPGPEDEKKAMAWLKRISLSDKADVITSYSIHYTKLYEIASLQPVGTPLSAALSDKDRWVFTMQTPILETSGSAWS